MVVSVAVIRALCGRGEGEVSSIGWCLVSHVSQSEGRSGLAKTQRGCDIRTRAKIVDNRCWTGCAVPRVSVRVKDTSDGMRR
jgi:hypothetical protein